MCRYSFVLLLCTLLTACEGIPTPGDVENLAAEAEDLYNEAEEALGNACSLKTLHEYATDLTKTAARIEETIAALRTSRPPHRPPVDILTNLETGLHALMNKINSLLEQVREEIEKAQERACFTPQCVYSGQRGRPKLNVTRDQIGLLGCEAGLSWSDTARSLGISRSSLYRRRKEFGMTDTRTTDISNDDLDTAVREVTTGRTLMGVTMTGAAMVSRGIRVSKARIHESLRRINPHASALRWRGKIRRMKYFAPSPNWIWHIDSNHKLAGTRYTRWNIAIQAGTDGYSRLCTFIGATNRNSAVNMREHFLRGARQFGLPSRIRTDKGGENREIVRLMMEIRGPEHNPHFEGPSVHNTRIERFWRDVRQQCTQRYMDFFWGLERALILDANSEEDIAALHYVFLPRINRDLSSFQKWWNNHKIRTAKSKTPNQLFLQGFMKNFNSDYTSVKEYFGLQPPPVQVTAIIDEGFDPVFLNLSDDIVQDLQAVNPLADSADHGKDLYLQARAIIKRIN